MPEEPNPRELLTHEDPVQRAIGLCNIFPEKPDKYGSYEQPDPEDVGLVREITKLAKEDSDPFVRHIAIEKLDKLLYESSSRRKKDKPLVIQSIQLAVDALIVCLGNADTICVPTPFQGDDPTISVRYTTDVLSTTLSTSAHKALLWAGYAALEPLIDFVSTQKGPAVGSAYEVIKQIFSHSTIPKLITYLDHPNQTIDQLASSALHHQINQPEHYNTKYHSSTYDPKEQRILQDTVETLLTRTDAWGLKSSLDRIITSFEGDERKIKEKLGQGSNHLVLTWLGKVLDNLRAKKIIVWELHCRPPGGVFKHRAPSPRLTTHKKAKQTP